MSSLGICVGASSVSIVVLENNVVKEHYTELHEGNPKEILEKLIKKINLSSVEHTLVTGRKFKEFLNLETISEPEAIESAVEVLGLNGYDTIISAGGENFIVYSLDKDSKLSRVQTGNKCASGTGEFFVQQITRMGLTKEKAIEIGMKGTPHKISGRCSVFCKSDCTHALNKGEKKDNVVAGLCEMMASKIIALLSKGDYRKVMLIGGTSKNTVMLKFLQEKVKDITIIKESPYFEAVGVAYAAQLKSPKKKIDIDNLFLSEKSSFSFHKPLKNFINFVDFKSMQRGSSEDGDSCIIGLDVGSTTTKAVVIREKDNLVIASSYLRTNGDPVGASVDCYKEIKEQVKAKIKIIGLAVTGSGRQIAGLHALTKSVFNEIIAHATAAAFFDKDVDTIFEIGGQDAKYTYLVNGVACDYAMNEACSAGTGSFLEESAKESLGVDYTEIGNIALKSEKAPNFNDQCAAFISSDIKNASHEGLEKKDIIAGLVYSICLNYVNRVKGTRPVGKKIFMQGGVCYNKAVPVAMAALTGKDIIVPPEPGLMGAFGAALELKKRVSLGILDKQEFSLNDLIKRKINFFDPFTCYGDKNCDRKCEINMLEIEGKKYPFGGACNKYYNQIYSLKHDTEKNDLVSLRQKLVYEKYASLPPPKKGRTMGITKSFLTNTYYPLYYNFFTKLGMKVVLPDEVDKEGMGMTCSSFCYPVEVSHGLFRGLLLKKPDFIFLPHIGEVEIKGDDFYKKTCVFVQSEPYYIKTAFKEKKMPKLISPFISFGKGLEGAEDVFVSVAKELGFSVEKAKEAYSYAVEQQRQMFDEFRSIGKKALQQIRSENTFAIVLFGRPYNAFAYESNLGIPHKFASRGRVVIPYDFLPFEGIERYPHMYWASGNTILKAANFIKHNPLLFGCFVTNFSCGPDSFIIPYFREIMVTKPSLTLELDSHSADAGINTRVEAALDIMESYSQLLAKGLINEEHESFKPAKVVYKDNHAFVNVGQEEIPFTDPRVKVIIPSMGEYGTRGFAAAFRSIGVRCEAMLPPTVETLKSGRKHTTCKECLPLILTTGTFIDYLKTRDKDEISLLFMPHGCGPCRQGQYHVFQQNLINKLKLKNTAILTLNDENSYSGFGVNFAMKAWISIVASEYMHDIKGVVRVIAEDRNLAVKTVEAEFERFLTAVENKSIFGLFKQLNSAAEKFGKLKLRIPLNESKFISLIGEVFVRRDEFSKLDLIETLEKKGFIVTVAPTTEYVAYCNYLAKNLRNTVHGVERSTHNVKINDAVQKFLERKVKKSLSSSGLIHYETIDVENVISHSKHLISEYLLGEAILSIGLGLKEIIDDSCGVISIGPFGCMPSRVAESILSKEMNIAGKEKASGRKQNIDADDLPFIAIETDGNMFPQIIQSRLEIFMLQADRLHKKIMDLNQ